MQVESATKCVSCQAESRTLSYVLGNALACGYGRVECVELSHQHLHLTPWLASHEGRRGGTGRGRSPNRLAENALVLCVDKKTGIQAFDRTQPGLPLRAQHANDAPISCPNCCRAGVAPTRDSPSSDPVRWHRPSRRPRRQSCQRSTRRHAPTRRSTRRPLKRIHAEQRDEHDAGGRLERDSHDADDARGDRDEENAEHCDTGGADRARHRPHVVGEHARHDCCHCHDHDDGADDEVPGRSRLGSAVASDRAYPRDERRQDDCRDETKTSVWFDDHKIMDAGRLLDVE